MPINEGDRYPQPKRPAVVADAVKRSVSRHSWFLSLVAAFIFGAIFGAK